MKYQYKIFYQSLEYPNNFTRKIVDQYSDQIPEEMVLESGNVPADTEDATEYHTNVSSLVSDYFDKMEADIVIVGEYYDERTDEEVQDSSYKIVGKVGENDRGTRAMTVYCTTKREIKGCRISTLDGASVKVSYIDDEYEGIRTTEFNVTAEDTRGRLEPLSKLAKTHIGQCIEVMIYNRYMLFAHIKGIGDKARTSLIKVLGSTQDLGDYNYTEELDDGTSSITYVVAGDLNANIKNQSQHIVTESFPLMNFVGNTNAVIINDMQYREYNIIQRVMNTPAKSSKGHVIHDGVYLPRTDDDRTEYMIDGSCWSIVKISDNEAKFALLGDHKGFVMGVEVIHSDSRVSSTTPLTRQNSEMEDQQDTGSIVDFDDEIEALSKQTAQCVITACNYGAKATICMKMYAEYQDKFVDFIDEALESNLDLRVNLDLNFELYKNNCSCDNIVKLYDFAIPQDIAKLYNEQRSDGKVNFSNFINELPEESLLEEVGVGRLFKMYTYIPAGESAEILWNMLYNKLPIGKYSGMSLPESAWEMTISMINDIYNSDADT